jgi:hypothetical protein
MIEIGAAFLGKYSAEKSYHISVVRFHALPLYAILPFNVEYAAGAIM